MDLLSVTSFIDRYLAISSFSDWPNALNGLQIENSGKIERIVAAVDACEAVIAEATCHRNSLLLVHHGLFWDGLKPIAGAYRRKLALALESDMALYSAHLPLDAHPVVGNNHLFARALGIRKTEPFHEVKGQQIGLRAQVDIGRGDLLAKVEKVCGRAHASCGGPAKVRHIGIITGAAGGDIASVAAAGIDTLLTGEGPHWSYTAAEELSVNLIYAGHYATETFGVKALAALLSKRFGLPWVFIDHPSGL